MCCLQLLVIVNLVIFLWHEDCLCKRSPLKRMNFLLIQEKWYSTHTLKQTGSNTLADMFLYWGPQGNVFTQWQSCDGRSFFILISFITLVQRSHLIYRVVHIFSNESTVNLKKEQTAMASCKRAIHPSPSKGETALKVQHWMDWTVFGKSQRVSV